jgi:putative MATE family efflux protein
MSGASETLLPMAREYLSVIMWGVFFSMLGFAGSCVIRACGSPNYAMATQLVGALLNVGLDVWLVLWLRMGVRGTAISTVISQGVSMFLVAVYFLKPGAHIRLRARDVFTPNREAVARILAVGTAPFLVNMTFVLIHGLMNVSVAKYGGDLAVAAMGIFMSLDSLLFMPAVAIGEGTQPIVGYNYGARRFDRVRQAVKWSVGATTVFYIISFLTIFSHTEFFIRLFNSSDDALIDMTARFMRISYLGIPVMGVSIVTSSTLQGLGHARDGLVLSFIRFGLLILVPLAILPRFWGVYGVWATFPLSDITGSAISFLFLRRVMGKMKRETDLLV